MKGKYDALLEWPFQHMVTMTLVNQKGNNNIVQSFRPNPTSTSFHQPKSDMNVASGCPKFVFSYVCIYIFWKYTLVVKLSIGVLFLCKYG